VNRKQNNKPGMATNNTLPRGEKVIEGVLIDSQRIRRYDKTRKRGSKNKSFRRGRK